MIAPAHADVLDQLRVASTGAFSFTIKPASPLPAAPQESVNRGPLSAKPMRPLHRAGSVRSELLLAGDD